MTQPFKSLTVLFPNSVHVFLFYHSALGDSKLLQLFRHDRWRANKVSILGTVLFRYVVSKLIHFAPGILWVALEV